MDVGSSFSAAAVAEDNLIDQLRNHGKKLVCIIMQYETRLTDGCRSSTSKHACWCASRQEQQHRHVNTMFA